MPVKEAGGEGVSEVRAGVGQGGEYSGQTGTGAAWALGGWRGLGRRGGAALAPPENQEPSVTHCTSRQCYVAPEPVSLPTATLLCSPLCSAHSARAPGSTSRRC